MRQKRFKIRDKMLCITILFISLFAVLIDAFAQNIILDTMERNIYKNINGVCNEAIYFIRKNYSADFHVSDGRLYAGNRMLSGDSGFLDALKRNFDAEISVFYGNVRYLTTIQDEKGRLLVHTVQDEPDILNAVFQGESYQAKDVLINGGRYYGVYNPLENSVGEVCGMVFAGVSETGLVRTKRALLLAIVIISVCLCAVIVFIVSLFTDRLCRDLECIRSFLDRLSRNEMNISIDERLLRRNDEVGELGLHSMEISRNIMELMNKDPLTSLYNRRSGEQLLSALCRNLALPGGRNLTFVMGDIDFFKSVNDTCGHSMGDAVLVSVAEIIRNCCPEPDFVIRWGGEEFLLILNAGKDGAVQTLCSIKDGLASVPFHTDGGDFHVTMTFGVSV
ncbi:MAG: diguanylate cyclase, partial [Treponemataceae bacterium]|nr:diguanylate cyclase [Treponemataceae bacterium]